MTGFRSLFFDTVMKTFWRHEVVKKDSSGENKSGLQMLCFLMAIQDRDTQWSSFQDIVWKPD